MRNIKRSKQYEEIVRRLTQNKHPVSGKPIFSTIRDLMCFAATLGFQLDAKEPFTEKTNDIDSRRFDEHSNTVDLIYLLALADTKDGELLRDTREEDRITIFEEYANGGLATLQRWMNTRADDVSGDKAILSGLLKDKLLEVKSNTEDAIADVVF